MCTLDRIILVMKEQGITQKQLTEHLGLGKSTFSSWKAELNESYKKYLPEIARYLKVSVSYLSGETEHKDAFLLTDFLQEYGKDVTEYAKMVEERKIKELSGVDFALQSETKTLTEEQKQSVLNYVKFLKSQE